MASGTRISIEAARRRVDGNTIESAGPEIPETSDRDHDHDGGGGGSGDASAAGAADQAEEEARPDAVAEEDDNVLSLDDSDQLPGIVTPLPSARNRKRKKTPKRKPATSSSRPTALPRSSPSIDVQAAGTLIGLAEGALMMAVGPQAKMTDFERSMIAPPAARMLGHLTPESAARVAAFADPLMLGLGICVYAMRVFRAPPNAGDGTSPARTVPAEGDTRPVAPAGASAPGAARNGRQLDDLHQTMGAQEGIS